MAKFFNQKVKKKKSNFTSIVVICSIVGILLLIFVAVMANAFGKNSHSDAVITLRDDAAVEVNNDTFDKTLFFEEIKNVKENDIKVDYSKVNFKEVGTYEVKITIYKKKYIAKLQVVDTEAPVLKVKDVNISVGDTYNPKDFVESCKDNSNKECIIEFYDSGVNQNGEKIDYSSFTGEGSYTIQIIASDESGNKTSPVSVILNIGKGSSKPTKCTYGNNEYDVSNHIMAVDVTDNGCALDLNLYQNEEILAPVNELIKSETEKIKKEFSKIKLNVKSIYINSSIGTILNTSGKGVVGYSVKITISIYNNDVNEVIEEYYLNTNGSRNYLVNKYL